MYVGVGGNEFGEVGTSTTTLPPKLEALHHLVVMGRRAAESTGETLSRTPYTAEFQHAAQVLVPADARAFAAKVWHSVAGPMQSAVFYAAVRQFTLLRMPV